MHYDEFGLFHENAAEVGLPYEGPPVVRREFVEVEPGRRLSALVWGAEPAELVLLHGGAQNAHTWDTVALALRRPLVAIDLPGHGHSDHTPGGPFLPEHNAADVEVVVRRLAPGARVVVGMSLGGLTAIALADRAPDLVRDLVLVDVTPGVHREKAAPITQFISGPESFASFDEILDRTIQFNPRRRVSSLRRGVLHNAVQRDDGRWVWRYQRPRLAEAPEVGDFTALWDAVSRIRVPILLVRGMAAGSVVDDDDVGELLRRQPDARVAEVEDAGHSVQGDQPLRLAQLIAERL
jgi:pimeloyl-ACP methyl ester carboxylesterase